MNLLSISILSFAPLLRPCARHSECCRKRSQFQLDFRMYSVSRCQIMLHTSHSHRLLRKQLGQPNLHWHAITITNGLKATINSDANAAACTSWDSLANSCLSDTSDFKNLPFTVQASCFCYINS